VTFLVVYNVVHLALRSWGLSVGWRAGMGVAGALGSRVLHAGLRLGAVAALFTIGLALPLVSSWLMREFGASERLSAGAVAALGLVLTRVLVPRVSGVRLGLALVLTAVAVGVLWR
jgi:mannose/fructose/N-acetylgalactosamine-specific phosphotransferase system component IID